MRHATGDDQRVDPDHLAAGVQQGPPEFPGLIAASVWIMSTGSPLDDAQRNGASPCRKQLPRSRYSRRGRTGCPRPSPIRRLRSGPSCRGRAPSEALGLDLEDRDVRAWSCRPAWPRSRDRPTDTVISSAPSMTWRFGEDRPVLVDDDPRAQAALVWASLPPPPPLPCGPKQRSDEVVAEELLSPSLVAAGTAHDLLGADVDDFRRLAPRDLLGRCRAASEPPRPREGRRSGVEVRASAAVGRWIYGLVTTAPNNMAAMATEKNDAIVRLRVFIDLDPPRSSGRRLSADETSWFAVPYRAAAPAGPCTNPRLSRERPFCTRLTQESRQKLSQEPNPERPVGSRCCRMVARCGTPGTRERAETWRVPDGTRQSEISVASQ